MKKDKCEYSEMTIYEIKERVKETGTCFFSPGTMKLFNYQLSDFKVVWVEGRYRIRAPMHDNEGRFNGYTTWYFNPKTNDLEML